MPTNVTYPDLLATFALALDEVLAPYLNTGGTFVFTTGSRAVHQAERLYDKKGIIEQATKPRIAFLGSRMRGDDSPGKCEGPGGRVFTERVIMERAVHVLVPRNKVFPRPPYTDPDLKQSADKQMIDQVWQNLLVIFQQERQNLRARGIWQVHLDAFPEEISDEQWYVNRGLARFHVQYNIPL